MTRFFALDIFRIIICASVFLFHAGIHKILPLPSPVDSLVSANILIGAIYMDAFFILSGFILFIIYGYSSTFNSKKDLFNFYKKRLLRIYPQYIIYTIIIIIYDNYFDFSIFITQIFTIQGFFIQFFNKMGNGGTWFISCIVFLYIAFPFLCVFIKNSKHIIFYIFIISLLIFILNLIVVQSKINTFSLYINPLYRCLPFIAGMLMAEYCLKNAINKYVSFSIIGLSFFIFIIIYILYNNKFIYGVYFSNKYTLYSFVVVPILCFIIYALSIFKVKSNTNSYIINIINIISNLTFSFYMYQGLALRVSKVLIEKYNSLYINNTILFFIVNLLFSIASYFVVEKFLTSHLKKLLIKQVG